jgi:nitrate/nitrite-specific signal transduction histidine kinase
LASDNCGELRRACREIRNEVYKHLEVIENTRRNVFQATVSTILATISFLTVIISGVESYKILIPNTQIEHNVPIATLIIFVGLVAICLIVFFTILKCIEKYIEKRIITPWKTILESIAVIYNLRKNSIEEYVNKLDDYCGKLNSNNCSVDYDIFAQILAL